MRHGSGLPPARRDPGLVRRAALVDGGGASERDAGHGGGLAGAESALGHAAAPRCVSAVGASVPRGLRRPRLTAREGGMGRGRRDLNQTPRLSNKPAEDTGCERAPTNATVSAALP